MMTKKLPHDALAVLRYAVLFLFFIQSAGVLVEAIYILDLMNTRLDEKAAGILFFFSPVGLLLFRRGYPAWLSRAAALGLFFSRGIVPYLDTGERLLAAGIATGAALVLLPIWLGEQDGDGSAQPGHVPAAGFALALAISVLLRALNFSLDLSLEAGGGWIGWGLGLLWLAAIFMERAGRPPQAGIDHDLPLPAAAAEPGAVRSALGIFAILALGYLAFFSPGVIARWTEGSYTLIAAGTSLLALGWLWLSLIQPRFLERLSPALLGGWNLLFAAALGGLIASHGVAFPAGPGDPAVVVGAPSGLQGALLAATLLLSPVMFCDLAAFTAAYRRAQPSPRRAAGGFLLGALLLVVLIFMHIFSNVWAYVEPVSPFFRGKFWLPYLLPALLAAFLAPWAQRRLSDQSRVENQVRNPGTPVSPTIRLLSGLLLGGLFAASLAAAWLSERTAPPPTGEVQALKVMTYNIQQANDENAQRAHLRQLALIREVNPDVLALQESDSARISLGNNDYVRYYAGKLGYTSYYGPRTVTGTFGTALLSRYPLENPHTVFTFSDQDEIGTTIAEIQAGDRRFTLYNVHPDGSDRAMLAFAEELLRRAAGQENVIALGDFNLRPYEAAYQLIDAEMINAWTAVYPDGGTMPAERRIDHIFVSPALEVRNPVYLLPPESATDHPTHWAEIGW